MSSDIQANPPTHDEDTTARAPGARRTRFELRAGAAVLVGLVAVLIAIFGTVELDATKQQERASYDAAEIATQIFEGTAVVSQINGFGLNAQEDVRVTLLG